MDECQRLAFMPKVVLAAPEGTAAPQLLLQCLIVSQRYLWHMCKTETLSSTTTFKLCIPSAAPSVLVPGSCLSQAAARLRQGNQSKMHVLHYKAQGLLPWGCCQLLCCYGGLSG